MERFPGFRVGVYRESPGSDIIQSGFLKKLKVISWIGSQGGNEIPNPNFWLTQTNSSRLHTHDTAPAHLGRCSVRRISSALHNNHKEHGLGSTNSDISSKAPDFYISDLYMQQTPRAIVVKCDGSVYDVDVDEVMPGSILEDYSPLE